MRLGRLLVLVIVALVVLAALGSGQKILGGNAICVAERP